MDLAIVWFVAIALLWVGYLVLEGFDFGVGMLLPVLSHDNTDRRVLINTIGPVWDGNEVWMIAAVGAMFAAFPGWYATVLSSLYLPILAIILALVLRGVAFEFRHQRADPHWQRAWDAAIVTGSLVPAAGWGAVLATLVRGLPVDAAGIAPAFVGQLVTPAAGLGAVTMVLLCLTHGAVFIALKTTGPVRVRARRTALTTAPMAAAIITITVLTQGAPPERTTTWLTTGLALSGLIGTVVAAARGREGWAFIGTAAAIAATVSGTFVALYPNVIPSTLDARWSLTIVDTSASPYTLTIMTWAALALLPLILAYQTWTYWVFRQRISRHVIPTGH